MKNPIKAKTIVVAAITVALMIAIAPLPFVFLVPLLFTCVTRDIKTSVFMGLSFGLISFVYALMGGSVVSVAFVEAPWIAIVPRVLVAVIARGAFVLSSKLIKGESRIAKFTPYAISAALGSLFNTALVVICFYLFMQDAAFGNVVMYAYIPTMLISGLIEFLVCIVIVPPLAINVGKALKLNLDKKTTDLKKETNNLTLKNNGVQKIK